MCTPPNSFLDHSNCFGQIFETNRKKKSNNSSKKAMVENKGKDISPIPSFFYACQ